MTTGFDTVTPGEAGMSDERLGWARDLVRGHVASGGAPSMVVVVLRRGKAVFVEAAGVKEPGGPQLEPHHVWPVASAGKPLISATVLSLVEDGLIGIFDPVVEYFPELDRDLHGDVLVHHVLTHTTGWESTQRTHRVAELIGAGTYTEPPPGRDIATHLQLSVAFDPVVATKPGVLQDYDSGSFELAGELVRRVTGGSLHAALRERILDPLSMSQSALIIDERLSEDVVHRAGDLPFGRNTPLSFEGKGFERSDCGANSFFTSPLDLAVFAQMILQRGAFGGARILSPASVRSMVTDQIPGTPAVFGNRKIPNASWGYGFTVVSTQPFAYFVGGLLPLGSVAHPGAGGVGFWVDFENEIVGVGFEVITEISEFFEPISGIGHRLQNVITGAVER